MRLIQDDSGHRLRLQALRSLTPEARVRLAFELSEITRDIFAQGLRARFPDLPDAEFSELLHARLELCHNRNY